MGNPIEPRRSLRILAKQKFREEQANSLSQESVFQSSSEKQETSLKHQEVEETKTDCGRGKGKGRKRKRTSSPGVSSPPKKQAKKNKQTSEETQSTGDIESVSCVGQEVASGEGTSGRRHSKRRQSKEEPCPKGNTSNRERESVIVDATSVRKKRSRKDSSNTGTERQDPPTESAVDLTKKGQSKSRSSKTRGKSKEGRVSVPKGKGRGNWSSANYYSLPSLVDFTKLNMASPE